MFNSCVWVQEFLIIQRVQLRFSTLSNLAPWTFQHILLSAAFSLVNRKSHSSINAAENYPSRLGFSEELRARFPRAQDPQLG